MSTELDAKTKAMPLATADVSGNDTPADQPTSEESRIMDDVPEVAETVAK